MKSILHIDTFWTFLKLNTLAGLVAILGKSDVILSQHFIPSYDVTMQFCSGEVKTTSKWDIIFMF